MYRYNKRPALPKREEDPAKHPPSNIDITIVPRDRWYGLAPQPSQVQPMTDPHKQVCFVSTESTPCTNHEECVMEVRELQKRNMVFRNWPDMPFNFLIGGDGYVYEGRGFLMTYTKFGNPELQTTLQIGYIGEYKDKDPPQEMVDLGALLIEYGKQRNYIAEDYTYMECPLTEYYQFPKSVQEFFESPGYKEFLASIPALPPPKE